MNKATRLVDLRTIKSLVLSFCIGMLHNETMRKLEFWEVRLVGELNNGNGGGERYRR